MVILSEVAPNCATELKGLYFRQSPTGIVITRRRSGPPRNTRFALRGC